MKIIKVRPGDFIGAGQQGEELARRVEFDITGWETLYGVGAVQFLVKRMGDEEFYPVAIEQEPGVAIWTVTVPENLVAGSHHTYELRYYAGETLAKSVIGRYSVNEGFVGDEGEVPGVHQGWVEQIIGTAATSIEAKMAAEAARDEADESAKDASESAEAAEKAKQDSEELAENIGKSVEAGVEAIQAEGGAQVEAVRTEGNTQVERVVKEGAEQVAAAESFAENASDSAEASALSEWNAKESEKVAKAAMEAAQKAVQDAENVVNNAAWVDAEINENGHLIVTQSDNFTGATFAINENGNLEVSYT